jgi:putative ABC transport system permease protein
MMPNAASPTPSQWSSFVREHLRLSGVRPEREAEIVEDLLRQLDDAYREALASGATEMAARAAAERHVSDWAVLRKEISASEVGTMPRMTQWQERAEERDLHKRGHFSWLTDLRQDVLFGLRMLRKTPGVTAVALLALALGIGANAAIFSVINAVLLRPLPYPSPDRIVAVHNLSPVHFVLQPDLKGAWAEWADHTRSFEFLAADETGEVNLAAAGSEPERAAAAEVSRNFFDTIGVSPEAGRTFSPEEEVIGHPALAILSDILCRRFGAPRDVVGKTILINGKQTVVIGVMPPNFDYPGKTMLWLPAAWTWGDEAFYGSAFVYKTIGRLKPEISLAQAREELNAIYSRVMSESEAQAGVAAGAFPRDTVEVTPLHEELAGSSRSALLLLLGAVAFVLLIACADVANIVLARAVARQREIALRAALGASRMRLIRQGLTESLLLSAIGGGAGLIVADWALHAVRRFIPAEMLFVKNIGLDGRVLIFLVGISVLSGLIFGLLPVLHVMRIDLNQPLKEGAGSSPSGKSVLARARGVLAVSEMAMAIVLLAGAGLLIKSLWRLVNVDPGFRSAHVLTARITLPGGVYAKQSRRVSYFDETLERISALPGVDSAGYATSLPFAHVLHAAFKLQLEQETDAHLATGDDQPAHFFEASPGYFRAMGIPLLKGRFFQDTDRVGGPPVVLVNETLARMYWPNENPIGRRIENLLGDPKGGKNPKWAEIVGVVGDSKHGSLDERPTAAFYLPVSQGPPAEAFLVARVSGDPGTLENEMRATVAQVDSALPLSAFISMTERVSDSVAAPRFRTLLLGVFAGLALILAAAGIYGVMSYNVASRVREIGIRMALGAAASDVVTMVLEQTIRLTLMGVAIGLAASWGLSRFLSSVLFGVAPHDPGTLIAVSALLCGVALFASYIPARRAARVDPLIALRHE